MTWPFSISVRTVPGRLRHRIVLALGLHDRENPGRYSRLGLAFSGVFLIAVSLWALWLPLGAPIVISSGLLAFGSFNVAISQVKRLKLAEANLLALSGHFCALLTLYIVSTRVLDVVYSTDGIIATYMGITKVLRLQNPYLYSIKPFLDQFGLSPAFYTPRVDGSFEFHLNYPAVNFLLLLPMYLVGVHDLRDGILIFHVLSVFLVYRLAPARLRSATIAPFSYVIPFLIANSYTDSAWAFLLLLSAVSWYRNKRASFTLMGLAGAYKQIALVAAPLLLIRIWHESAGGKVKAMATNLGILVAAFLIPNLPFIILSPQAWWAGVVEPYLPSSNPQIMGGIGLAGILSDVGVALPPLFFIALMVTTLAISSYLYATRFDHVKHFMWAFPAVILFFYYRSFPNYLFYWAFPLVFELSTAKLPSLGWNFPLRLKAGSPRLPSMRSILSLRRKMAPPLLIVLALTTTFIGVSGAYISLATPLNVRVHVNSMADPDGIGETTLLNVTLSNSSSERLLPKFFVKWSVTPFLWVTNSSVQLAPRSNGTYLVSATDPISAIPIGSQFRVFVYHSSGGQLLGQSEPLTSTTKTPIILNPHFRWWTLDWATGRKVPFGWKLTLNNVDATTSGIGVLDLNETRGVQFKMNYTSASAGAGLATLSQRLIFNATSLDILVFQPSTTDLSRMALGGEVTDGTHVLYFVFSDAVTQSKVSTYSSNTTVTLPLTSSTWSWVQLDTRILWTSQGWGTPKAVDLSIFLETRTVGVYSASIREVQVSSSGSTP